MNGFNFSIRSLYTNFFQIGVKGFLPIQIIFHLRNVIIVLGCWYKNKQKVIYRRRMSLVYNNILSSYFRMHNQTIIKCLIKILSRKYVNFKFDHFRASLIRNPIQERHDVQPLTASCWDQKLPVATRAAWGPYNRKPNDAEKHTHECLVPQPAFKTP